ncbi:hypothetical protein Tco_0558776 [Tanacetum coccineum]
MPSSLHRSGDAATHTIVWPRWENIGTRVVAEGSGGRVVAEGSGVRVVAEGRGSRVVAEGRGSRVVAGARLGTNSEIETEIQLLKKQEFEREIYKPRGKKEDREKKKRKKISSSIDRGFKVLQQVNSHVSTSAHLPYDNIPGVGTKKIVLAIKIETKSVAREDF